MKKLGLTTAAFLLSTQLMGCVSTGMKMPTAEETNQKATELGNKARKGITDGYNALFGKTQAQQIAYVAEKTGETVESITAKDAACPEGQKIDTENQGSVFNPVYAAVCAEGQHYAPKQN